MTKDFLFFTYSWVDNANLYFKSFETLGYSCDFVDEHTLSTFIPSCDYRCVVLYLHERNTIPITNFLIDKHFSNSILIQHDDTDFEDVQKWSNRPPDLVMQREYTNQTKNPYNCPVEPFHFPIPSIYNPGVSKSYDVCFIANITNPRRIPFANKLQELANNELKHLNWYIDVGNSGKNYMNRSYNYTDVVNASKIGIHYYGNSYDSIRIWEIASCQTALLMPPMRNLSVSQGYMPFTEYVSFKEDFSDLKDQILYLLKDNNWFKAAVKTQTSYNQNHTPEKCIQYYQEKVLNFIKSKNL